MHDILENMHPKIRMAFRGIIIDIAKQIHDEVCEENFYTLVRFACENWVDNEKESFPVPFTPKMRQLLFEIVSDALLEAYKFDPEKLAPEQDQCQIKH